MKKITFFIVLFIGILFNSYAEKVPIYEAQEIARKYYYKQINRLERYRKQPFEYSKIGIANQYIKNVDNNDLYYVFNMQPAGFVIVSAYDNIMPIIGYAFEGSWNDNNLSPSQQWWMKQYEDQILYAIQNYLPADENSIKHWNELRTFNHNNYQVPKDAKDIEPLLSSLWNQNSPYNGYCPLDPAGPGGRVYAGCVATAMSQVMYYYRYPIIGVGSYSYTHTTYGVQSANFAATTYQWESMKNSIDPNNFDAIAQLMYHCGVSVNMDYGPDGSGAYSNVADDAFRNYFSYPYATYRLRSSYNATTWETMLLSNLDVKRPVYYSGQDPTAGGHAFVCDGYQGSAVPRMFHFNWGWSGSGDGFFLLTDMNSGNGSFTQSQACIEKVYPPSSSYPYNCSGTKVINGISGTIDDGSGPIENYANNIDCFWLLAPYNLSGVQNITLTFLKFDTELGQDSVTIYDGATTDAPILGSFSGNAIPPTINSTNDTILIRFKTNATNTAQGWLIDYTSNGIVHCSSTLTFTLPVDTFTDGSGPNYYYNNNANCKWKLMPNNATTITLNFLEFDTEPNNDKLRVYNKASSGTLVATLSGNTIPSSITSTFGSMYLIFTTSPNLVYPGWKAYYTSNGNTVGTMEKQMLSDLVIYLDNTDKSLNVVLNVSEPQNYELKIFNILGQPIYQENVGRVSEKLHQKINMAHQPAGIYTLMLVSEKGKMVRKVVLK